MTLPGSGTNQGAGLEQEPLGGSIAVFQEAFVHLFHHAVEPMGLTIHQAGDAQVHPGKAHPRAGDACFSEQLIGEGLSRR